MRCLARGNRPAQLRGLLEGRGFDARMRPARAVIIAVEELSGETLAASAVFEIATRARQGGVPAYAVCARGELGAFDARMLDLQAVLRARGERALTAAGTRLAALI